MRKTLAHLACILLGISVSLPVASGDVMERTLSTLKAANDRLCRFTLPNGMVCLLKEDHTAPVVSVQIWVGTGSIHEEEYLGAGLSHAIEHMIFKGTPTRAPGDITREINDAGGRINAYTTLDRVVFHTDLPSRHWRVGFDALADSVMNANFPAEEWEQERDVILREFAMGKDDPGRVMNKLLWRTAFRKHPYRMPVIGYEDIFKAITQDDLVAFFSRHYVSDNMFLVIVGDVDVNAVKPVVEATFAPFIRRPRAPSLLPAEPQQIAPRIVRETGAYKVSRLSWAHHTVSLDHPDAAALDVLANIAGQGRSSRLVKSLVEDQRLAHQVSVWSYTPGEPGLFGISATFDPENEAAVLSAIEAEVRALRHEPFTEAELQKATRAVLTGELSALSTMKGQASSYGSGQFYAGDPRFGETYIRQLQAITPEELQRVANTYLNVDTRSVALLTPEAEIKGQEPTELDAVGNSPYLIELDNGIRCVVREDHRLPFVYLTVALRAGLLSENAANVGITAMMSELLLSGTRSHSREEIARMTETLGSRLSAYSGNNGFGLRAKCLAGDLETVAALLADCLQNPVFPEDEIEKQRTLQLAAILRQEEKPMFLAQRNLREAIFAGHPYRWDRLGTRDSVKQLAREQLQEHHSRHLLTGNLVVSVFGDITGQEARELTNRTFAAIPLGNLTATPNEGVQATLPTRIEQEEPRQQAIVLAGFPAVSLFDPRHDALNVLQTAMSGLSSDLAISVRDKRGLAYFVGAYQHAGVDPGLFGIYAGTRRGAAKEVETLYLEEIQRVTTEGLREEELARAKNRIIADHEMQLQNNMSVAMTCGLNELYGLGYDYAYSTADRINALTIESVRTAAASVLRTDRMAVSLLLPEVKQAE
ncbi:MAG: insulinase family protein [Verrucomicrobia bacterium]|jgi:zinc protease|nr:insulinase family protein [Verrucomicrobiota bacterium]